MIDYIRYTVDGKTYDLTENEDGTWSKEDIAPNVMGRYDITIELSQNGVVTFIDNLSDCYEIYLKVIQSAERVVRLQELVPEYINRIREFNMIYEIENLELDKLYATFDQIKLDNYIGLGSSDAIARMEKFIGVKPEGTLEQRKSYIKSLYSRGNKLNETSIKSIVYTITGADCVVTFFSENDRFNPEGNQSLLKVQVLSPDGRDYRYEDIERALKLLIPAHLKLSVKKYFSLWDDIKINFSDWNAIKLLDAWGTVKQYIPPL